MDGAQKDLGFMVMNALSVLLSGTDGSNAGQSSFPFLAKFIYLYIHL